VRLLLISPENDADYPEDPLRRGIYPPLGLLSIATYARTHCADASVRVVDENIAPTGDNALADADWVGIYATSFNYGNALRLAEKAKDCGANTVLGGPHATALAERILIRQPAVDHVVKGEGEIALLRLMMDSKGSPPAPNVLSRDGCGIVCGPAQELDIARVPRIDRSFVDMEAYAANFRARYPELPFVKPASVYSQKGCNWRTAARSCLFCARLERTVRTRRAHEVWAEIGELASREGADCVWDVSDDVLTSKKYFAEFVRRRPPGLDVSLLLYARADGITEETVSMLRQIGCHEVFIGLEAGDNAMLRAMGKGTTVEENWRAVELLGAHGIAVFPSFVLASEGETADSLTRTEAFIERVVSQESVYRFAVSVLLPLPGSRAFQKMIEDPVLGAKYGGLDALDLAGLERDWVEHFTQVSYEYVKSLQCQLRRLKQHASSFLDTGAARADRATASAGFGRQAWAAK